MGHRSVTAKARQGTNQLDHRFLSHILDCRVVSTKNRANRPQQVRPHGVNQRPNRASVPLSGRRREIFEFVLRRLLRFTLRPLAVLKDEF
jgi:hypothetical protein